MLHPDVVGAGGGLEHIAGLRERWAGLLCGLFEQLRGQE